MKAFTRDDFGHPFIPAWRGCSHGKHVGLYEQPPKTVPSWYKTGGLSPKQHLWWHLCAQYGGTSEAQGAPVWADTRPSVLIPISGIWSILHPISGAGT